MQRRSKELHADPLGPRPNKACGLTLRAGEPVQGSGLGVTGPDFYVCLRHHSRCPKDGDVSPFSFPFSPKHLT